MALAEACDRERHDRRGRGGERGEPEPPSLQARQLPELVLGAGDADQDRFGAIDQEPPGLRQHRTLGNAADQLGADLGLERRYLPRDRRLRVAERLGSGRERALAGDLNQHAQAP